MWSSFSAATSILAEIAISRETILFHSQAVATNNKMESSTKYFHFFQENRALSHFGFRTLETGQFQRYFPHCI